MSRIFTILMADDDPDDQLLVKEAFEENSIDVIIAFVANGEEVIEYLELNNAPDIIFLDLNMPCKDGREALREIKQNESYKKIPVIVLTTSKAAEDISNSYELGVNSYIVKPVTFESLKDTVKVVSEYWLDGVVRLPSCD